MLKRTNRGISSVVGLYHVGPGSHERLLIRQARIRVEQVVDVDTDKRPRAAESQDLADAHVHLSHVVAIQLARASRRLTVC